MSNLAAPNNRRSRLEVGDVKITRCDLIFNWSKDSSSILNLAFVPGSRSSHGEVKSDSLGQWSLTWQLCVSFQLHKGQPESVCAVRALIAGSGSKRLQVMVEASHSRSSSGPEASPLDSLVLRIVVLSV
jgi:microcompartment protein CcmK/EutM